MITTDDYKYAIAIMGGILILIYPDLVAYIVGLGLIIYGVLKIIEN
ncbi:DUF3096 domain-containing protein [Methanosphaera cuniculi]|uniref:DUF3096 domain-containing protein n=1 Tax=Methanosphaera cuniculi TaxID=1077256 RepID=A0A2V2BRN4_9EURY|nr:DUF3096 domain-containing protein [Methanosphaera cuniculi]PWL08649.1 hypothetical protein MSCUN_03620 [Methanosphaera cuniculi]